MRPRYRADRGRVWAEDLPKGPHGRALCRRCNKEVPVGRYTFCSNVCVHEWKLTTDGVYLRKHVFLRDRGVCSMCELDTEKLKKILVGIWLQNPVMAYENAFILGFGPCFKAMKWWRRQPKPRSLWEADHINAVVEGGGSCGMANIRTLCRPCHLKVTSALRARIKRRK